jgi:ankyrin repeat protein
MDGERQLCSGLQPCRLLSACWRLAPRWAPLSAGVRAPKAAAPSLRYFASLNLTATPINSQVDITDPTGDTPLHWAVENVYASVAELLLENKAQVDVANQRGDTCLHAAASSGCELHPLPAPTSCQTPRTCLLRVITDASTAGRRRDARDTNILRILLDAGANAKAVNAAGDGVLHVACRNADLNAVKALVKAGAKVKAPNGSGATPLHEACHYASLQTVKYLIQRGADVGAATSAGRIPLQNAVKRKNTAIVEELCEKGVDVSCLAKEAQLRGHGWTPLHLGAEVGSVRLLQLIAKKGTDFTDPEAVTDKGETALDIARASAHAGDRVVKLLEEQIRVKKMAHGGGRRDKGAAGKEKEGDGSQPGSRKGSAAPSAASSRGSSRQGSRAPSAHGSRAASRQGSMLDLNASAAGSRVASKVTSAVTSKAPSTAGSQAPSASGSGASSPAYTPGGRSIAASSNTSSGSPSRISSSNASPLSSRPTSPMRN